MSIGKTQKKSTKNVYFCDNFVTLQKLETPQPT